MITGTIARDGDPSRKSKPVLAICGAGNAGHALAIVTSQRFEGDVVWLTGSEEKAELLRRNVFTEGLRSTGVIEGTADKVKIISWNPAEVIPIADLVLIAVPAFAHAIVLRQIAPFLKERVLLGVLPSRGGFEFEVAQFVDGIEPDGRRRVFGLQTLPWSTRVQEPGRTVNFGALKAQVLMATIPARRASAIAAYVTQLLGIDVVPTHNFLNMTLGNPGQVIHPGLMYGFFASWQGRAYLEEEIPRFYADADERIGGFVDALSTDIVRVADRVAARSDGRLNLSGVLHVHDWLKISYPTQTADQQTVGSCFRTGPLQHRKAPMTEANERAFVPNFAYRYLSEDVPYGLAVTRAIAEIAGVKTPAVDCVIAWAQAKLGKRYLQDGALNGADAATLPVPQNYGVTSFDALVDWYEGARAIVDATLEETAL